MEAHRRARRELFTELLSDASTADLEIVASVLHRLADRIDVFPAAELTTTSSGRSRRPAR